MMIQHRSPLPLARMEEGTVKKSTVFGHWTSGLIGFCFAFQVGSVRFFAGPVSYTHLLKHRREEFQAHIKGICPVCLNSRKYGDQYAY